MDILEKKCVMVIDSELPLGIIANTAAIMGITLGRHIPESVGPDVTDKTGNSHLGIIQIPVPILKADREKIRDLRQQLYQPDFAELIVVDFSEVAQTCNHYDDFTLKASQTETPDMSYYGLAICGPTKLVNTLTGSMPLMR